jgi:hypothetical protein
VSDLRLPQVGLCSICRHAQIVPAPRAAYWLCRLAADDTRFERYPRLPVLTCPGHQRGEPVQIERPPASS